MIKLIHLNQGMNLSFVLPETIQEKGYCIGLGEYFSPHNFSIFFNIPDKNVILMGRIMDMTLYRKYIPGYYFLRNMIDEVMAIQYSRIVFHKVPRMPDLEGWENFMKARVSLTKEHIACWEREIYYPIINPWGEKIENVMIADL